MHCAGKQFVYGQETQENVDNASTYLDRRVSSFNKSLDATKKLQQKLLKRLQKKEDKMLCKLARQDSSLYKQYISSHQNYDSILALSNDTTRQLKSFADDKTIDSLKGIQHFIQDQL